VVAAIEPELLLVEAGRAVRKSATANLDAFDCCMRGVWHYHQFQPDDNKQAETWLRRSIELDPKFAPAYVALAGALGNRVFSGWSRDIGQDLSEAYAAGTQGAILDERDSYAHYALAFINGFAHRQQQALAEAQRAIDLNPNFALGLFALGWIRTYLG